MLRRYQKCILVKVQFLAQHDVLIMRVTVGPRSDFSCLWMDFDEVFFLDESFFFMQI